MVGEKDYYVANAVSLSFKDSAGSTHSCNDGVLLVTNMRIQFSNTESVWEEPLENIGVCSLSNNPLEKPCILCQVFNNDSSHVWVISPAEPGQINFLYEAIIKCLELSESL